MRIEPSVVGITMVRDEVDIIEETIGHMLGQLDAVIVADNCSTDGTREILEGLPVLLVDDPEVGYYQSRKMSRLAELAADQGAGWVVPFDADELWTAPNGTVAEALRSCSKAVATAPIINQTATDADDMSLPPVRRMEYRHAMPLPLPKVACRPALPVKIAQGNHAAHYPEASVEEHLLTVRHFPYRSADQFLSKVRNGAEAYLATDLPKDVGAHWRQYGELLTSGGPEAVREWFREHFLVANPADAPNVVHDPVLG